MEIQQYKYVYPVKLDTSKSKDITFTSLDKEDYSLIVNRGNIEFFGLHDVFIDSNQNIFLGINELLKGYNYTLNLNNESFLINAKEYSSLKYLIDLPIENATATFTFTDSKPIVNSNSGRCDMSMNGPSVFIRSDDNPVSNIFNSTFIASMGEVSAFQSVLSVDGIGHIIYVGYDTQEKEEFDVNENNTPKATRTLFELLKLMVEWKLVAEEPWNSTDTIALAAKSFFEALQLPIEIENDIVDNQCDMQVARYIKGSANARRRPDVSEISQMTAKTEKWLNRFCFHENIDLLYERIV